MKKSRYIFSIVLFFLVALLIGFYIRTGQEHASNNSERVKYRQPSKASTIKWFVIDSSVVEIQHDLISKVQFVEEIPIRSSVDGVIEYVHPNFEIQKQLNFNEVLYRIKMDEAFLELSEMKTKLIRLIGANMEKIETEFPSQVTKWKRWMADLDPSIRFKGNPRFDSELERSFAVNSGIFEQFLCIRKKEVEMEDYLQLMPDTGKLVKVYAQVGSYLRKGEVVCTYVKSEKKKVVFILNKEQANSNAISKCILKKKSGFTLQGTVSETVWKGDFLFVTVILKDNISLGEYVTLSADTAQVSCKIPTFLIKNGSLDVRRDSKHRKINLGSSWCKNRTMISVSGLQIGDTIVY